MSEHYIRNVIEAALLAALPRQIAHAKRRAPGFARILAGVDPAKVRTRKALAALPVTQGIAIDGSRVASTQHLPPTLSLQFHPRGDATIDPYVGVGVNHTFFFREALPGAKLQLSDTWGYAGQMGVDWHPALLET